MKGCHVCSYDYFMLFCFLAESTSEERGPTVEDGILKGSLACSIVRDTAKTKGKSCLLIHSDRVLDWPDILVMSL